MADIEPVTFAQYALRVSKSLLPPYRSKYSKRIYTQPQLLAILCLIHYREWAVQKAVRWLSEQKGLQDALELSRVPHPSTLYRFRRFINIQDLSMAFEETLRLLPGTSAAKASPESAVEGTTLNMDDKKPKPKEEIPPENEWRVHPGSAGAYEGVLRVSGMPIETIAFPDELIKAPSWLQRAARSAWFYPLFYLLMIAFSESVIVFYMPPTGLLIHGILLITLFLHASFVNQKRGQYLFLAFAFAPLMRILSLSLPLNQFPEISRYVVLGMPLLVGSIYAVRVMGLSGRTVGITVRSFPLQIPTGLTGIGIGCFQYLILEPTPLVETLRWREIWLPALVLLLFSGFLEEFIFRGLMQSTAIQVLGLPGVILVAALYAVMHLGHRSALEILFMFDVALFFGLIVQRTGSLLGVALAHGLTNITLYLVFPFLLTVPDTPGQALLNLIGGRIEAIIPAYSTGAGQIIHFVAMMLKM